MKARFDLDKRTEYNGRYKVRMRVSVNGTSAYIPTGVMCEPNRLYPSDLDMPIHPDGKRLTDIDRERNAVLTNLVDKFFKVEDTITHDGSIDRITANEVRDMIAGNRRVMYIEQITDIANARSETRTKNIVLATANKLKYWLTINGYGDDIDMSKFTKAMAFDFKEWIEQNLSASSVNRHITYTKMAWVRAHERGMIDGANPWQGVPLPRIPAKDIDALTVEQLRKFLFADSITVKQQRAQMLGFISFALCGANMADIWNMVDSGGDEVVFVREKTKRKNQMQIHIRIEPELAILIKEHSGTNTLFNFCETTTNLRTFEHLMHDGMNQLSNKLGFKVNFAKMRRTWATIAEDLDINRITVDKALGHAARDVTGRHYAKFNWERVADANRKVLDYVLYDKK